MRRAKVNGGEVGDPIGIAVAGTEGPRAKAEFRAGSYALAGEYCTGGGDVGKQAAVGNVERTDADRDSIRRLGIERVEERHGGP